MNNFNFSKEMVYGKKHLDTLIFDIDKYNITLLLKIFLIVIYHYYILLLLKIILY